MKQNEIVIGKTYAIRFHDGRITPVTVLGTTGHTIRSRFPGTYDALGTKIRYRMNEKELSFVGWGIVGDLRDGLVVRGCIDVTGYNAADYWHDGEFLGPDIYGIVPIYRDADQKQFPRDATPYPYLA